MERNSQILNGKENDSSSFNEINQLKQKVKRYKERIRKLKQTVSVQAESLKLLKNIKEEKCSDNITEPQPVATENTFIDFVTRYWELVSHLPEVIFETDASGKLTFLNQQALEQNGYNIMDFRKGLTLYDLILPEDHPRVDAALENAKKD